MKTNPISRSISILEYKVEQSAFFLECIENSGLDFFSVQCFTDAFVSACRSITLSLQAVASRIVGFKAWYSEKQKDLGKNEITKFMNLYRNASIHIGETVVRGGEYYKDPDGNHIIKYYFMPIQDLTFAPEEDVLTVCRIYFSSLLDLVFEAFEKFKCELDDSWYFTQENFERNRKTVEDAVEELGFPRGWLTAGLSIPETEVWRTIRRTQTVGCALNRLFHQYLGKVFAGPDDKFAN